MVSPHKETIMSNKLIPHYKGLLKSLNCEFGNDDAILIKSSKGTVGMPVTYRHKTHGQTVGKLYLPTKKVLNLPEDKRIVKFHPIAENRFHGRSDIFNKLVVLIQLKLRTQMLSLIESAFLLAADADNHKNLRQDKKDLISHMDTAIRPNDLKFVKAFVEKMMEYKPHQDMVCKIKLDRDVEVGDKVHYRSAKLTMPIMSKLETLEKVTKTLKYPNNRTKSNLAIVLENLFGTGEWEEPSSDEKAPYYVSLLSLYAKVSSDLNKIAILFDDDMTVDLSWAKDLNKIEELYNEVPFVLPGNDSTNFDVESKDSIPSTDKVTSWNPEQLNSGSPQEPILELPSVNVDETPISTEETTSKAEEDVSRMTPSERTAYFRRKRREESELAKKQQDIPNEMVGFSNPLGFQQQQPNAHQGYQETDLATQMMQRQMATQQQNPFGMPQQQQNPFGMPQQQKSNLPEKIDIGGNLYTLSNDPIRGRQYVSAAGGVVTIEQVEARIAQISQQQQGYQQQGYQQQQQQNYPQSVNIGGITYILVDTPSGKMYKSFSGSIISINDAMNSLNPGAAISNGQPPQTAFFNGENHTLQMVDGQYVYISPSRSMVLASTYMNSLNQMGQQNANMNQPGANIPRTSI